MQNRKITVYGLGGTGINIAESLLGSENAIPGTEISIHFVDTSESNITPTIDKKDVYRFEGTDGAGQEREKNNALIAAFTPDILLKHPPKDMAILIHSASGGTGAVAGFHLMVELLKRKIPCVAFVVGQTESVSDIRNTLKTLRSLHKIPRITGLPCPIFYIENVTMSSRFAVNGQCVQAVLTLAQLWSTENHGIDSSDTRNFLQYTNVLKDLPALLCGLSIVGVGKGNGDETPDIEHPISVMSMITKGTSHKMSFKAMYAKAGYVEKIVTGDDETEQHMVLATSTLEKAFAMLEQKLEEANSRAATLPRGYNLIHGDDSLDIEL